MQTAHIAMLAITLLIPFVLLSYARRDGGLGITSFTAECEIDVRPRNPIVLAYADIGTTRALGSLAAGEIDLHLMNETAQLQLVIGARRVDLTPKKMNKIGFDFVGDSVEPTLKIWVNDPKTEYESPYVGTFHQHAPFATPIFLRKARRTYTSKASAEITVQMCDVKFQLGLREK